MARATFAVVVALMLASCSAVVEQPAAEDEPPVAHQPPEIDEPDDDVVTIRGTLEDSETDTGRPGEVRAYRSNEDGTYALLDADTTDGAGNFELSFQDDAAVFDLQARLKDGAVDASYVRTITLPVQSASDLLVRAVPYTGLRGSTVETDITIEQFREFIIYLMDDSSVGLLKWRQGEPEGIEVLHEHVSPDDSIFPDRGYFTQDDLDAIEDVLRSDDARVLLGGRDVRIQIDGPSTADAEKHYSYHRHGRPMADDGWIIVHPVEHMPGMELGSAKTERYPDGHRRSGRIVLSIDDKAIMAEAEEIEPGYLKHLIIHEFAHVFYSDALHSGQRKRGPAGHTVAVRSSQSIVSEGELDFGESPCRRLCFADRKALQIVYEDTFPAGVRARDVLLGLGWHD